VALRHNEFLDAGAVVAAIDVDSTGQHAAMVEKLNLPFPMLSDPDRELATSPYGLMNRQDPRGLPIPATILIDPEGEEVLRLVSRDFADRPFEGVVLEHLRGLALDPVQQAPPASGDPAPGPKAMPFGELRSYFRGAKFGAKAVGLRAGATEESEQFGLLMDHYMEDVAAMYRIIRDRDSN
jgi:hypothetical protein